MWIGAVGTENNWKHRNIYKPREAKKLDVEVPKAFFPLITKTAIALIMKAYKRLVYNYNQKIKTVNNEIIQHNKNLLPPEQWNKTQQALVPYFYKHNGTFVEENGISVFKRNPELSPEEYNKKVDEFNTQYKGALIPKVLIPNNKKIIKPTTEKIFGQLLYLYNIQLQKYCQQPYNGNVKRDIPPFKAIAPAISRFKANGVTELDFCSKTISRHLQILKDIGVLVNYDLRVGECVNVHINPDIFAFVDGKDPNNSLIVGKYIKEMDKVSDAVGLAKIQSEGKTTIMNRVVRYRPEFYRFGDPNKPIVEPVAFDSSLGISRITGLYIDPLSKQLQEMITPEAELFSLAEQGAFSNYNPIDIEVLEREVHEGTLNKEAFTHLIAQDFLKQFSKFYKGKTVYANSYKVAYGHLISKWFADTLTTGYAKKSSALEKLKENRRILNFLKNFTSKNKGYRLLYPSMYFDPERTTKMEGGFSYAKTLYRKHQERQELKNDTFNPENQKRQIKAIRRKIKSEISYKVSLLLFGKVDHDQFFKWVEKKYPSYVDYANFRIDELKDKYKDKIKNFQNKKEKEAEVDA